MIHAPRLLLPAMMTMFFVACANSTTIAQVTGPAAADAQSKDIQRRVLLASLSAYSPWTRQEAQEKLTMMGESVEPGLVLAAATAVDNDARQRARTVLDEIRTQRRLRGLMEATRVTLHFDRAPARQVLASLYVRAGWEFRVFPPDPWESAGNDAVTVHLEDVPFWDAVAKVEELTGLTLVDAGWGASFSKLPAGVARRRMSVHGPFRVVADDGGMPGSIASLKVFLEPKIRVVSHARLATLPAGDDRAGGPLARAWLADPQATSRVIGGSDDVLDVQLPLVGLAQPIAHVKGTISTLLVAREELVDELHPTYGSADLVGRRFTWNLKSSTADKHVLTVGEASVRPLMSSPLGQPARLDALPKNYSGVRPTLLDARGVPLLRGREVMMSGYNFHDWNFYPRLTNHVRAANAQNVAGPAVAAPAAAAPPACGPPVRMRLAVPTVMREIAIPFEFTKP